MCVVGGGGRVGGIVARLIFVSCITVDLLEKMLLFLLGVLILHIIILILLIVSTATSVSCPVTLCPIHIQCWDAGQNRGMM